MIINHTLGAVLNGGESARMGTHKSDLEHHGVKFIDHVLGTMSLVVKDIVVCGGSYEGQVPVLEDSPPGVGPLGGLRSALAHSDGRPVLVCAVDMPLVTADLLRRLSDPPVEGADVHLPESEDGSIHPLCAAYGPGTADIIDDYLASGARSVLGVVDQLNVRRVDTPGDIVVNINTMADFHDLSG